MTRRMGGCGMMGSAGGSGMYVRADLSGLGASEWSPKRLRRATNLVPGPSSGEFLTDGLRGVYGGQQEETTNMSYIYQGAMGTVDLNLKTVESALKTVTGTGGSSSSSTTPAQWVASADAAGKRAGEASVKAQGHAATAKQNADIAAIAATSGDSATAVKAADTATKEATKAASAAKDASQAYDTVAQAVDGAAKAGASSAQMSSLVNVRNGATASRQKAADAAKDAAQQAQKAAVAAQQAAAYQAPGVVPLPAAPADEIPLTTKLAVGLLAFKVIKAFM